MDALILARIQFAANISFHILFPTITIALGWFLLYFRLQHLRTGEAAWLSAYRFWVKVMTAACLIPVQIFVGDLHGLNTLEHQPAKVAAMEGVWETERGAPLLLFAVPDEEQRENHFEIGIPKLASLILTHDLNGEIKGLNDFEGEHPKVAPVFYGFRIMVGIGVLMLLTSWVAMWQLARRKEMTKGVKMALVGMTFSGWVATLAGWYVTEIGRQPWLVQGLLKTADAVSPVPASNLALTLAVYLALYTALIIAYVSTVFHLARKPTSANPTPAGLPEGATAS